MSTIAYCNCEIPALELAALLGDDFWFRKFWWVELHYHKCGRLFLVFFFKFNPQHAIFIFLQYLKFRNFQCGGVIPYRLWYAEHKARIAGNA